MKALLAGGGGNYHRTHNIGDLLGAVRCSDSPAST